MELFLICIVLVLYFTPTLVARARYKRNAAAITVLNVFLGWTLIGWVIALVWACTVDQQPVDTGPTIWPSNNHHAP